MPGASQDPRERKIVASLIEMRDGLEAMIAALTKLQAKRRLMVHEDRYLAEATKAVRKIRKRYLPEACAPELTPEQASKIAIWLHGVSKLPISDYFN